MTTCLFVSCCILAVSCGGLVLSIAKENKHLSLLPSIFCGILLNEDSCIGKSEMNCLCKAKFNSYHNFMHSPLVPKKVYYSITISNLQVDFMEAKVSPPLSLNATNVKHAREYVKELAVTREKESVKHKAVDKLKAKEPKNKGKIVSLNSFSGNSKEICSIARLKWILSSS